MLVNDIKIFSKKKTIEIVDIIVNAVKIFLQIENTMYNRIYNKLLYN